jgi:hypothetical protein
MFPELVKSEKAESGPLHGFDGWRRDAEWAALPELPSQLWERGA